MKRVMLLWGPLVLLLSGTAVFLTVGSNSMQSSVAQATPAARVGVTTRACEHTVSKEIQLECYDIAVGEHILSTTVLSATGTTSLKTPLVYLAGGPGEGGNTSPARLADWSLWYQRMALTQDFVLVDLRGLSPSQPSWDCGAYDLITKELWQQNLTYAQEAERSLPVLGECYQVFADALLQRGIDGSVEQFNSRQNAADLADVLSRLGYQQWDLLGVSYGTRVALTAALSQPQVRRVILDSPYPLAQGELSDTPRLWAQAFTRFFSACDQGLWLCPQDADSEALFWRVYESLREQPITVTVENWSQNQSETWLLNGHRFAAVVYSAFYSSELFSMVYPALQALSERDTQPAQFLLELFYNTAFDPAFNDVIFWATECNDNAAESEVDYLSVVDNLGLWAPLFADDWRLDFCRQNSFFTPGQKPAMEKVRVPTLIAVGKWDPVTPATDAQALLQWLPRGLYLPLPDHSHAEFFNNPCAAPVISWFLSVDEDDMEKQWPEQRQGC